ncbi:sugar phosphate nucleotidyltransferase [Pseudopelagicola sp. nBUS_20]|uniref:sugar phosphate nucleotidyltransferase n=1 Tax=Pseudopelagicola sp. nBUS_20 TaxID=3395317 RepID=UPI003EBB472D
MSDCVILAGGLGTRLRPMVSNVPKPMANINSKPFLEWQLEYLIREGATRVILSVGYKGEVIESYFGSAFKNLKIEYAHEETPLGTGGGLLNAVSKVQSKEFFVFNGDTFFPVDFEKMLRTFRQKLDPTMLLATFRADKNDRYGALKVCPKTHSLLGFESSKSKIGDSANGGVYLCNRERWVGLLERVDLDTKISLEDDLIPILLQGNHVLMTKKFDNFFIDIGTPEDYRQAKKIFTDL